MLTGGAGESETREDHEYGEPENVRHLWEEEKTLDEKIKYLRNAMRKFSR